MEMESEIAMLSRKYFKVSGKDKNKQWWFTSSKFIA
jgi:hypothetical protein